MRRVATWLIPSLVLQVFPLYILVYFLEWNGYVLVIMLAAGITLAAATSRSSAWYPVGVSLGVAVMAIFISLAAASSGARLFGLFLETAPVIGKQPPPT